MIAVGPLVLLPVFGLLAVALVVSFPEYGIAMFLSTFLVTYPQALQGTGMLTINNALGGIFLVLLSYKVYSEQDWWFLRLTEIRLLPFILLVFYLAGRLNGPDPRMLTLLGVVGAQAESLRTLLTRSVFTVFFINYIRTPKHVIMIYSVAMVFMISAALSGVQSVMHGTALHGYRAATSVIAAAINPNRLAMFSIMPIAGLWYLMRSLRLRGAALVILPLIAVLALAVFMTGSRSGLLGLGVCGAAIMIDERLSLQKMAGLALAGILMLILVVEFVPQRTYDRITNLPFTQSGEMGEGSGSLDRRAYGWQVAFKMFKEHPVIGIGIGNWGLDRFLHDPGRSTAAPHSSYVLAAVEGGFVCLLSYLVILWRTWCNFRYAAPYVSAPDSPLANLSWVVKSARTVFIVMVFFSFFADLWQFVTLFLLVGLGIVLRRLVDQSATEEAAAW
jgi:O-antigen ligase